MQIISFDSGSKARVSSSFDSPSWGILRFQRRDWTIPYELELRGRSFVPDMLSFWSGHSAFPLGLSCMAGIASSERGLKILV
jgi:hypothetical protein